MHCPICSSTARSGRGGHLAAASPDQFAILARRYRRRRLIKAGSDNGLPRGCGRLTQISILDITPSLVSSRRMATSRRLRPGAKEPLTGVLAGFMTDRQFKRLVRSVGVSCFVKYLNDLTDLSLADGSLIQKMSEAEGYTYGACHTRVFKAREIIRAGRAPDVLKLASRSSRVSPTTAAAARHLLGANDAVPRSPRT